MDKILKTLAEHEECLQVLSRFKKELAESIEACELPVMPKNKWGISETETDEKGFPKTHLWHAFRATTESDCGYGNRLFTPDEVHEYLHEEGCEHCINSLRILNERAEFRKRLGAARRAIRVFGKKAIKELENKS